MKTKKTVSLALFALIISCALVTFGCEEPAPTPTAITFNVTPDTPNGKNTKSLEITFSDEVTGLTAGDITITNSIITVTKGTLSGSGREYSLAITLPSDSFANTYPCSVSVSKTGVSTSSKQVNIVNNEGKADFNVEASKVKDAEATLTISLTKKVTLTADQITLDGTTGKATMGDLKNGVDDKTYELSLTAVTVGTINVKINNDSVNPNAKSLELSETSTSTTEPTPGTGNDVIEIRIDKAKDYPYSNLLNDFEVETGFPRRYGYTKWPSTATPEIVWAILDTTLATVDKDGMVKPNANGKTGSTMMTITAKKNDGTIGATSYVTLAVKPRIIPDKLVVSTADNTTAGGYNNTTNNISSENNNGTITLYIGDKPVLLTVGLSAKNDSNNDILTNDQALAPLSPKKFTLTPRYMETPDSKLDVPRSQFSIYTTPGVSSNGDFEIIQFKADYNHEDVIANVSVKFVLKDWGIPSVKYFKESKVGKVIPSNGDMNEPYFNGETKTIYVVVESNAPYGKMELSTAGNASISYSGPFPIIAGKTEEFTVKLGTDSANFNLGNYSMRYTLTSPHKDGKDYTDATAQFKYTTTP